MSQPGLRTDSVNMLPSRVNDWMRKPSLLESWALRNPRTLCACHPRLMNNHSFLLFYWPLGSGWTGSIGPNRRGQFWNKRFSRFSRPLYIERETGISSCVKWLFWVALGAEDPSKLTLIQICCNI